MHPNAQANASEQIMMERLQAYANRLEIVSPEHFVTADVAALVRAYEAGEVPDLKAALHSAACRFHATGKAESKGTPVMLAYDILAISLGYENPAFAGHYFRERASFHFSEADFSDGTDR